METVIELMRIAITTIHGLFVARSKETFHAALMLSQPRGASAWVGGCERRKRPRDMRFALALRVASGYVGYGGSPP